MVRWRRVVPLLAAALLWGTAAFGWSFAVCGDSRDDRYGVLPRILAQVQASDMELLLHTGDLEAIGGTASWKAFKARTAGFTKPLFVVFGNHEIPGGSRDAFAAFFGIPSTNYAFTRNDARFVILDNAGGRLPPEVLAWLDRELAGHPKGTEGVARIVVAMHVPPWMEDFRPHGTRNGYAEDSARLQGILLKHKVDLVLCSHEHLHRVMDWGGIKVIVSGGAGAPLFPFERYGYYRVDLAKDGVRETFMPVPRGNK